MVAYCFPRACPFSRALPCETIKPITSTPPTVIGMQVGIQNPLGCIFSFGQREREREKREKLRKRKERELRGIITMPQSLWRLRTLTSTFTLLPGASPPPRVAAAAVLTRLQSRFWCRQAAWNWSLVRLSIRSPLAKPQSRRSSDTPFVFCKAVKPPASGPTVLLIVFRESAKPQIRWLSI